LNELLGSRLITIRFKNEHHFLALFVRKKIKIDQRPAIIRAELSGERSAVYVKAILRWRKRSEAAEHTLCVIARELSRTVCHEIFAKILAGLITVVLASFGTEDHLLAFFSDAPEGPKRN